MLIAACPLYLKEHSYGEYVRRTLRDAESLRPSKSATAKLVSIREAVNYTFPTADIDDMNREIEQGYRS